VFPFINQRLTSFKVKGVELFDAPLVVDEDISDLELKLPEGMAPTLNGNVDIPAGEPPEDWVILVFPADRRLWKEPFAALRRFYTVRVNSQRGFMVRPPPGNYLLAVNKGIPPVWMEESTLEEFAKTATSVTIVDGDVKTVQVKR
jgi:hypothetical protein